MFSKVIFWCEFPRNVDWVYLDKLLKEFGLNIEVYVVSKSLIEFKGFESKIKSDYIKINAWPVLDIENGYWFSGFTKKEDIDALKQYKGYSIKIDLEPPIPKWEYSNFKLVLYGLRQLFRSGENNTYLKQTIYGLAEHKEVGNKISLIVNEFPLPSWYLKKQGIYINPKENMIKNIMGYTTFGGPFLRPFLRAYMKYYTKKAVKKYGSRAMFSIGLIGPGILRQENFYSDIKEFKEDLGMINNSGANSVAIYTIEALLKRENSAEWLELIKSYVSSR